LYSHVKGDISDPENMVIRAEEIFPMNIGTSAYTEYKNDVDSILDMFDTFPGLENGELKQGHIHTHHGLGSTSFSGTDMSELQDNAPTHNYYLSLIMDFKFKPTAKIATGTVDKKTKPQKKLGIYDCIVSFDLDQHFLDRFSVIRKKKAKEEEEKERKRKQNLNKGVRSYNTQRFVERDEIPENVKGWEYGIDSGVYSPNQSERTLFFDPVIDEKSINTFIYRWFNLNSESGYEGTIEEAVDDMEIWLEDTGKNGVDEFSQLLIDNFDDIAIDVIGQGYYLTNDEYLKIIDHSIDILGVHDTNKVVKILINELETYKEIITEEIEVQSK